MFHARIKILHLIAGLNAGGAERMLVRLLARMNPLEFASEVASLSGEGALGGAVRALGVPLHALEISGNPAAVATLAGLLRSSRPDIVQGWMYHGDVLGTLARLFLPRARVVWNVRGDVGHGILSPRTECVFRACAAVSRWVPDVVLFNSERALAGHRRRGYACRDMRVIANGFDLSEFRPDASARVWLREVLGLPGSAELVGMAAGYAPKVKDYSAFLAAAEIVTQDRSGVWFVACGRRVSAENAELVSEVRRRGLEGRVFLLGERRDMARLLAALDVFCLASRSEGFPNVVGEAMACGVPVVTTDVGDARALVGEEGRVVGVGDARGLAAVCLELLAAGREAREALGRRARERVGRLFEIGSVARRYEGLYRELCGGVAGRRGG